MVIALIIISLINSGCTSSHPASDNYIRVAASTNSQLQSQLNLKTWGSGVHMKERKINVYEAAYLIDKPLSRERVRIIALQTAEIIKNKLNNDPKVQEYLYNRPMDNKNILFSISYTNSNNESTERFCFAFGKLRYSKIQPNTFEQIPILEETYEEAVERAGLSN